MSFLCSGSSFIIIILLPHLVHSLVQCYIVFMGDVLDSRFLIIISCASEAQTVIIIIILIIVALALGRPKLKLEG